MCLRKRNCLLTCCEPAVTAGKTPVAQLQVTALLRAETHFTTNVRLIKNKAPYIVDKLYQMLSTNSSTLTFSSAETGYICFPDFLYICSMPILIL